MAISALVICIGTGFTTSGAATDSLSLTTAPEYIAEHNGVAHRSGLSSPGRDNRFAGSDVLGGRTVVRTLGVASESGGKADLRRCTARKGLAFYKARAAYWAHRMGEPRVPPRTQGASLCPRYLAALWRSKAHAQRRAYEASRTLVDFPIRPGNRAWLRAVEEAQRPYPGSRSWLLSCSAAEGGWGRWVIHGGNPYYPGVENVGTSSGHLQYRYSTFKGHYRRALDDLRARGFRLPEHLRVVSVTAWRSALGQALAGGWGILHGQRSHWSASYGRGC